MKGNCEETPLRETRSERSLGLIPSDGPSKALPHSLCLARCLSLSNILPNLLTDLPLCPDVLPAFPCSQFHLSSPPQEHHSSTGLAPLSVFLLYWVIPTSIQMSSNTSILKKSSLNPISTPNYYLISLFLFIIKFFESCLYLLSLIL